MNKERLVRLNRERYMAAAAAAAMHHETDSRDNVSEVDIDDASMVDSQIDLEPGVDSAKYVDRVLHDSKEAVPRKEEKKSRRSDRGGLLLDTESSKLKRKSGGGVRSAFVGNAESSGRFRETNSLRLRQAHSKISSEVAADKDKLRRSSQAPVQRSSPSSSARDFESIKVTISRSPAPDDRSSTSSVIESAEEFLRESATKQPLFSRASPPREVTVVSSPRSQRMQVIEMNTYLMHGNKVRRVTQAHLATVCGGTQREARVGSPTSGSRKPRWLHTATSQVLVRLKIARHWTKTSTPVSRDSHQSTRRCSCTTSPTPTSLYHTLYRVQTPSTSQPQGSSNRSLRSRRNSSLP